MATAFGGEPLGNVFTSSLFESRAGYVRRTRRGREEYDDEDFTPTPRTSLLERLHIVRPKPAPAERSPTSPSIFRGRQRLQTNKSTASSARSSSRVSWRSMPLIRRMSSNLSTVAVDSRESGSRESRRRGARTTTRDARSRAELIRLSIVQEDAGPSKPPNRLEKMYQAGLFDPAFA